jgi:hypothetical protein
MDIIHSSNSSSASERGSLMARSAQNRGKYTLPLVQHAGYDGARDDEASKKGGGGVKVYGGTKSERRREERKGVGLFMYEVRWTLGKVIVLGGMWYFWLVWRDRQ